MRYETDRLEIAPEFSHPICAGTLDSLDAHVKDVERSLMGTVTRDPLRIYWMTDGIAGFCRDGSSGCFFPGTRVLFAHGPSIAHEVVHAVLDSGGETYFVEEGMAEVFSGSGVFFDATAREGSLSDGLALSRSDYRNGALDYASAAHFVRWVQTAKGFPGMLRLAKDVGDDANGARLRRTIEDMFETSLDQVEVQYRESAPRVYRSLYDDRIPVNGGSAATRGIERELDCESPKTHGPLWDDSPGMFRTEWLEIPATNRWRLEMTSDTDDAWVVLFNPYARPHRRSVTPWMVPDPSIDPGAIRLDPGTPHTQTLSQGRYMVLFVSTDPATPSTLSLRLEPVPHSEVDTELPG